MIQRPCMNNEVHIKFGGDHGRGSFKVCYESANTLHPNSKDNTVICALAEAKDTRGNIRTTLCRFENQIDELQKANWK